MSDRYLHEGIITSLLQYIDVYHDVVIICNACGAEEWADSRIPNIDHKPDCAANKAIEWLDLYCAGWRYRCEWCMEYQDAMEKSNE